MKNSHFGVGNLSFSPGLAFIPIRIFFKKELPGSLKYVPYELVGVLCSALLSGTTGVGETGGGSFEGLCHVPVRGEPQPLCGVMVFTPFPLYGGGSLIAAFAACPGFSMRLSASRPFREYRALAVPAHCRVRLLIAEMLAAPSARAGLPSFFMCPAACFGDRPLRLTCPSAPAR